MAHQPLSLNPVLPTETSRYQVGRGKPSEILQTMVPSGLQNRKEGELDRVMHNLTPPDGWVRDIHVDGKPYFRHIERRIVTEAYVLDDEVWKELEMLFCKIESIPSSKQVLPLGDKRELYLTLEPEEGYYFVDHVTQSIFWLEDVPLEMLKYNTKPVRSFSLFMKINYYHHLENFPTHNKVSDEIVVLLCSALSHACIDHITSRDLATASWNSNDSKTFLDIVSNDKLQGSYRTWIVARLYAHILYTQWVFQYGMREAVNDRLNVIKEQRKRLTPWDFLFAFLCFFSPYTYAERLESVWAHRVVSLEGWNALLNSLLIEWSDSNLLATVSLTANMALLAISPLPSTSKYLSISSTLLSIGSLVVGIHHIWRHRVKLNTDAGEAVSYFDNATKRVRGGLQLLSILLSLPLVLLSWSIITFALAVIVYGFSDQKPWWLILSLTIVAATIVSAIVFFFEIFGSGSRWRNAVKDFSRLFNTRVYPIFGGHPAF